MAASLYKLGIGQLSDALAKLNLQTQKEPEEQQLEKDLIRYCVLVRQAFCLCTSRQSIVFRYAGKRGLSLEFFL